MFVLHDIEALGIREAIDRKFVDIADCGHIAPELAFVADAHMFHPKLWKRVEKKLISHARDMAEAGYCAPQDPRIRRGILLAGDGSIEATIMHGGERVVVVVGVLVKHESDHGPMFRAIAREAYWVGQAAIREIQVAEANRAIRAFKRANRRHAISPKGREVMAWRVPGTEEHGKLAMLEYNASEYQEELDFANRYAGKARAELREEMRAAGLGTCEGCLREVDESELISCGNADDGHFSWCPACRAKEVPCA